MLKKFFHLILICYIALNNLYSDHIINIYVYNIHLNSIKHYELPITKKYYNQFYSHYYDYNSRSKQMSIFIIQPHYTSEEHIKLKLSNFYHYFLTNLNFDFMHFLDIHKFNTNIQTSLNKERNITKKILCFNCSESDSYLYEKFIFNMFQQIKVGYLFFKDCHVSIKELQKLFSLYEDTNLWILSFATEKCPIKNSIDIFNHHKKTILIFNPGKNNFYKYDKHIFRCELENTICHVKIKFRESNFIHLENQFIKLYSYERKDILSERKNS